MLVIGISGATCSGKTTVALEIQKLLPNTHIIFQDDYFREVDDPKHKWIPELNHINFDVISSLDMEKMQVDIQEYISCSNSNTRAIKKCYPQTSNELQSLYGLQERARERVNNLNMKILIIEGFCIFNFSPLSDVFNLKYFLQLSKEECYSRRSKRTYEPPDCPGYFEMCVWPQYKKLLKEVQNSVKDVQYLDNESNDTLKTILDTIFLDIINYPAV